jgi:hypothetical protein
VREPAIEEHFVCAIAFVAVVWLVAALECTLSLHSGRRIAAIDHDGWQRMIPVGYAAV